MAAHVDDRVGASLPEIQRYLTKLKPLLALWNETSDPETLGAYWIVAPRLFAIIRHAEQMEVPAGLHITHQTLLTALACEVRAYLELIAAGSTRAGTTARSGMTAFRLELVRQLLAATRVGDGS
jgi:hypothetical protein